jgi:hypothetical protein
MFSDAKEFHELFPAAISWIASPWFGPIVFAVGIGLYLWAHHDWHKGQNIFDALYTQYGAKHPRMALTIVCLLGALIGATAFGKGWQYIAKRNVTSQQGSGNSSQESKQKPPESAKVEEKNSPEVKPSANKPMKKKPPSIDQHGKGNVNIDQHTEGANSPIVNSPITVNPPLNPNAPIYTFDFNGGRRTQEPGKMEVVAGEEYSTFQTIVGLEKNKDWSALLNICEEQIKKTPEWLTPYLFSGVAHINLGERAKGIERLSYVREHAGGNTAYAAADRILKQLGN